ncbi:MAG: GldG family protein, partial [Mariprofundaceae bacterium]
MKDHRPQLRRHALMMLSFVLIGCATLFTAAYLSHVKWDMTEEKIHTLSDSTRTILKSLDEPIMIRAYISADMPQPYGQLQRFLEDMLRAYFNAGNGQIGYEVINPDNNPNIVAALNALQIPKVQVQVIEDDRAQVKQGYLAVVIEYLDSKEVMPVIQSEEGFEFQLTGKIKKLTGKGKTTIGVVHGFG